VNDVAYDDAPDSVFHPMAIAAANNDDNGKISFEISSLAVDAAIPLPIPM
jgi:hypothetical protein